MIAAELLRHYERIAESSDAIDRLRRFVLDLAVRGKLVEQDPGGPSASDLLKQIAKRKVQLVEEGVLRKPRDLDVGAAIDAPFSLPFNWQWIRLDAVGAVVGGGTPSAGDADSFAPPGTGTPWLTPADLGGHSDLRISRGARDLSEKGLRESSATVMPAGTVLFTSRAPIGYVAIAANPLATNQGFKSIVPYVAECSRFIATVLQAFAPDIDAKAPGTTFKEVSGKIVAALPFPLAPLAEQHRIIAKVDELMALCDRLEAARVERETARDRLAVASLARLNAPDPETFADDARFALDTLPALTARPDQIKQVRKTILALAVRGKLKTADPSDEPLASVMARLRAPAVRSTRRGVPDAVEVSGLVAGWELPKSWARLSAAELLAIGALIDLKDGNHGANHPKVSEFTESGLPFITAAQVVDGGLDFESAYRLSGPALSRLRVGFAKANDVIYTHKGSVGRVAIAHADCVLSPQTTYYRPNPAVFESRYLMWYLASDLFSDQVDLVKKQTTRDFVAISKQYSFFHAVPPLLEQRRIVEMVDQLMALCDRLEDSLTTCNGHRGRLLETLLHDGLEPDKALEAAA